MTQKEIALGLSALGLKVFPAKIVERQGKSQKIPLTENGHLDATDVTDQVESWWSKWPDAKIGVATGPSGLNVADLDVEFDDQGNTTKDGFETLELNWHVTPDTFQYPTISGFGQHLVYAAPEGVTLNGQAPYRKMKGVDRRAGSSWILWNGPVPVSRDEFTPAPEWLNDVATVKTRAEFSGDIEEWYSNLTDGEPSSKVERAMAKLDDLWQSQGNDLGDSQMIERQYEAIRLGAEGEPGVPLLLAKLEEMWESRDPAIHSTPTGRWEERFHGALKDGITKYGATPGEVSNPALADTEERSLVAGEFLTADEQAVVNDNYTFIDHYCTLRGLPGKDYNPDYAVPAAWTILSMAFGRKAFIRTSKAMGVNLWFIVTGSSSSGKSVEEIVLRKTLDLIFLDGSQNYNLGAKSSPEGLQEALLNRDGKPSMVLHDEASSFFQDIRSKPHMESVPDDQAKWYEGFVEPSSKVRLKELAGKSAATSFNVMMFATPDRLFGLIDATQFESGYLARVNWIIGTATPNPEEVYNIRVVESEETRETPTWIYEMSLGFLYRRHLMAVEHPEPVKFPGEVNDRLNKAYRDFDQSAKGHPRYNQFWFSERRLGSETLFKMTALLALYEGRTTVQMRDALSAIHYATEFHRSLWYVADQVSESPYARGLDEIEDYIRDYGSDVPRSEIFHKFRNVIVRNGREMEDRLSYLQESGRIIRVEKTNPPTYRLNERI